MSEAVKCMDTDGILEVWNYIECENSSPEEVKKQRGLIRDTEGNVIVQSFGYTEEYTHTQVPELEKKLGESEWIYHYSVEGTLLRMFYHHEQWYLCTHKKLNAFKSRWSCKQTFGELLEQGLEEIYEKPDAITWLQEKLPTDKVYFFLVRSNQQNRIVCHTQHIQKNESIVFLGFYTPSSVDSDSPLCFQFYEKNTLPPPLDVLNRLESPLCVPPQSFSSVQQLCETVSTMDPFLLQGIIAFRKEGMESVKILNAEYVKYYEVRGNNPNLRFRYLEVRNDPEKLQLLYVLYPKFTILFEEYESALYDIARVIYQFYVNRYIKNQYVTLPREEYLLLKKCHQWYLEDRKNNRIFTQKVLEILAHEPPLHLYKMIKRYHYERENHKPFPVRTPFAHNNIIPVYNQKKNQEFMAQLPPLSPEHHSSSPHDD